MLSSEFQQRDTDLRSQLVRGYNESFPSTESGQRDETMIWLSSGFKTAFLAGVAVVSGRLCQPFPLFFPVVLFLGIAYSYRLLEWMRCRWQGQPIPWVQLRWHSWREGVNGLIVLFVSLFVALFLSLVVTGGTLVLVFSILSAVLGDSLTLELAGVFGRQVGYSVSPRLFFGMATVWFAIATGLYRYESWAQQRRKSRKTTPHPPFPVKSGPLDPVDLDLDRLRSDLGLTQMKARQRRKSKR
ncbi:hypothetical protein [Laspinema olomoucense]|uniref:Transmembrane protein n=1 Tax=Laspinema olomoucense D3b TaxID=2953688 RepID=A0ABT2NCD2_9CYAN|nr:hypothetical protein [Laspinema sp. D3b]MCT7980146.1 hypothetical protein [Laspinema sp. D3b]